MLGGSDIKIISAAILFLLTMYFIMSIPVVHIK